MLAVCSLSTERNEKGRYISNANAPVKIVVKNTAFLLIKVLGDGMNDVSNGW
jgi:hypothetical protein